MHHYTSHDASGAGLHLPRCTWEKNTPPTMHQEQKYTSGEELQLPRCIWNKYSVAYVQYAQRLVLKMRHKCYKPSSYNNDCRERFHADLQLTPALSLSSVDTFRLSRSPAIACPGAFQQSSSPSASPPSMDSSKVTDSSEDSQTQLPRGFF
ncbi:hypothetical protein WMY93_034334 [Mugilogobius chulae]|uniref:Uncharacterized protein n=1 Tax=Mugilogobius chulae TaxID=88201 RepID=A0AAW0ME68_9GOBI